MHTLLKAARASVPGDELPGASIATPYPAEAEERPQVPYTTPLFNERGIMSRQSRARRPKVPHGAEYGRTSTTPWSSRTRPKSTTCRTKPEPTNLQAVFKAQSLHSFPPLSEAAKPSAGVSAVVNVADEPPHKGGAGYVEIRRETVEPVGGVFVQSDADYLILVFHAEQFTKSAEFCQARCLTKCSTWNNTPC